LPSTLPHQRLVAPASSTHLLLPYSRLQNLRLYSRSEIRSPRTNKTEIFQISPIKLDPKIKDVSWTPKKLWKIVRNYTRKSTTWCDSGRGEVRWIYTSEDEIFKREYCIRKKSVVSFTNLYPTRFEISGRRLRASSPETCDLGCKILIFFFN
jgi:hypothetical protein